MIASIITGKAEYNPHVQNLNAYPQNLQKDFKTPVSLSDFIGRKDTEPKTLGFFDNILTLLYKANNTSYYIKIIDKKNIINNSYITILNFNYTIQIFDYMLNLETHWEDYERLYLVFEGIKRYTTLENLIKKHANEITEEQLLIIFRQILESVKYLHKNKIYGCFLYLSSFIYDKITQTIKFTDTGFSKVFLSSKNLDDNELQNGFTFNEYTPPEVLEATLYTFNINEIDKLKNENYDIWQLGILFFKIATFGQSPFENAKNENLRDCIINKNINYSKLNKYSSLIPQIIDKMLQIMPEYRYKVDLLINLIHFKDNKIPLLYFHSYKNEDDAITLNIVNEEKKKIGNDFKLEKDLNNPEDNNKKENEKEINNEDAKNKNEKEIKSKEIKPIIKNKNNGNDKIKLKGVKIQGNLVNDKMAMINQEIYPTGSVLPSLKKNYLNKFNNVDQNLVLELASKLSLLDKEYKKLDENKMAVYNITNYVSNNLKKLNDIDNENINLLIKKFNNLLLSKRETNELYEEMVKEKGEFSQDKFKALISNLIYEIKRLGIELEQEKSTIEKLRKKIKEQEKKDLDLKNEHEEKIQFYQRKIEILEEVIFSADNKSLNEKDFKNKNKLIYTALENSIQNFTDINIKLKKSLEENMAKFKDDKKDWLEDMIKAKEEFRNEMSFYLQKSIEEPKVFNFKKKEKNDAKDNKKNEEIEKLKKRIDELKETIKEQNNTIINSNNFIRDINKELKDKNDEIEDLKNRLKEKENEENIEKTDKNK